MSLIQVLNDNNPLPTKDLTRSLHQVIQVRHPLKALKVTMVFLSFLHYTSRSYNFNAVIPSLQTTLWWCSVPRCFFNSLLSSRKKISLSKVPSYIEAFKKELKITYPGMFFFTRYARVASLNRKTLKSKCFLLFMCPVSKGWCLSKTNKQLL